MKKKRIVCLLLSLIVMMAMSTTTADAASFKSKPTGVKAKCVSGVSVQVSCKAKKGAKGYSFYYATKKSGKYKLGATSKTRTGTVKGLTPGKTYYFKVKAYKGKSKKTYTKMSKPVKCKTVLKAPGITATDKCCCRVVLKMTGSPGCKGYQIYRSTNRYTGFERVATTTANTWLNQGLDNSTTYYYKVRSYSGSYHSSYSSVITVKTKDAIDGNHSKYTPSGSKELVPVPAGSDVLQDRKILFLGSSITYGSASGGTSFVDFIKVRDGVITKKLAVPGTTMAKPSVAGSYVYRLNKIDPASFIPDIFVCQLSLNDSLEKNNVSLGKALPDIDFENLSPETLQVLYANSDTVSGAIGYITAYASYYWPDSQIVFFTVRNNGYNTQYAEMRTKLYNAQTKYGNNSFGDNRIKIIDMWSIPEVTNLKKDLSKFCLYMHDDNHPTMAGYLYQWTPEFEAALSAWMPPMPEYYTVTWKNEDGTVLETDKNARYGERLSYDGAEPTKPSTEEHTYEFIGWVDADGPNHLIYTPEALKDMTAEGNVTYKAVFDEIPVTPADSDNLGDAVAPDANSIFNLPFIDNDTNDVDEPTDNGDEVDNGASSGAGDGAQIEEVLDITGMLQALLQVA